MCVCVSLNFKITNSVSLAVRFVFLEVKKKKTKKKKPHRQTKCLETELKMPGKTHCNVCKDLYNRVLAACHTNILLL